MNPGIHAVSQGLGCSTLFSLGSPNPTSLVDIGCMWSLGSFFVVRTDRLSLLDSTFGKMGNLGVRCGFYVLPLDLHTRLESVFKVENSPLGPVRQPHWAVDAGTQELRREGEL